MDTYKYEGLIKKKFIKALIFVDYSRWSSPLRKIIKYGINNKTVLNVKVPMPSLNKDISTYILIRRKFSIYETYHFGFLFISTRFKSLTKLMSFFSITGSFKSLFEGHLFT